MTQPFERTLVLTRLLLFMIRGDISRKLKLLKRQREGKKKMRMVANVELPREAFVNAFRRDPAS